METWLYENMSNEQYHSDKDTVSKSGLWCLINEGANKFKYKVIEGNRKQSKDLTLGSAVHTAILEPEKFDDLFVEAPEMNLRTKAGKEEMEAFKLANEGKEILKAEEGEIIAGIVEAVKNATASTQNGVKFPLLNYFSGGKVEHSIFFEHEGVNLRIRPDLYNEEAGVIIDLKTTRDCGQESFSKDCANYGYHVQAYMYSLGYEKHFGKKPRFIFLCIEKEEPYDIRMYELPQEDLELGKEIFEYGLKLYKEMKEIDFNPPVTVDHLKLPNWAFYKMEGFNNGI